MYIVCVCGHMSAWILWLQNILKNNSEFNNSIPIINKYSAPILIILILIFIKKKKY